MATLTGAPIWVTGWEHGSTLTTNGGGLCDSITGSPAVSTTQKRTGSYSLRITATAGTCVITRTITGTAGISARFYVYFATLPGADTNLFSLNGPTQFVSVYYQQSTSKLYAYVNSGTNGSVVGSALTTGVWYRVDCYLDCSGNPWSWKIRVDGSTESAGSYAAAGSTMTTVYVGSTVSFTGDYYVDDLLVTDNKADYPLGAGCVRLLQPNADGTIDNASNCIEDESGNDISGSHAGYSDVNSVPWSATNYLRVGTASSGKYLNMALSDLTTGDDPQAIEGLLAYTSASTSANNGACYLLDGSTKYEIWGVTGTLRDYSDGSTSSPYFKVTHRKLSTMTKSQVDALQVTWESGSDATPDPYLIDVWVEVAVATVTNYNLLAEAGSFALTGGAVTFLWNHRLFAGTGSFALTGNDAKMLHVLRMLAGTGSFALSGGAATFLWNHRLLAAAGSFSLSSLGAILAWKGRYLAGGAGAFTLTGNDAILAARRKLLSAAGSFALTGNDAILAWKGRYLGAAAGLFTLTGGAAILALNARLFAAAGLFTLTGYDVTFTHNIPGGGILYAGTGVFGLTGGDATLAVNRRLLADGGSFGLTGGAALLRANRRLLAEAGALVFTGGPSILAWQGRYLAAGSGSFSFLGWAAYLLLHRRMLAEAGAFILTGWDATLTYLPAVLPRYLLAEAGVFVMTGYPVVMFTIGVGLGDPLECEARKTLRATPRGTLQHYERETLQATARETLKSGGTDER